MMLLPAYHPGDPPLNSTQTNGHPQTVEEKRALLKKLLGERTVPARHIFTRDV